MSIAVWNIIDSAIILCKYIYPFYGLWNRTEPCLKKFIYKWKWTVLSNCHFDPKLQSVCISGLPVMPIKTVVSKSI